MNELNSSFLLSIILFGLILSSVSAQVTAGVKNGQWIEYNVYSTGSPMQGHDVIWARIEIVYVEGLNIAVSITSRFNDDSTDTTNHILNLETGHLIDSFIIPSNLTIGDTFKDENLGIVKISTVEQRSYAGSKRTVISSSVGNNTYVWDQITGVNVEGNSKGSNWTIHTSVSSTNMWLPDNRTDWLWIALATIVLVIIILIVAAKNFLERNRSIGNTFGSSGIYLKDQGAKS